MKQPYVSTLIEQDFTSAEKALGRHNIDAISSADLEGYATQEWVQDQNYITSADLPDVSDMATKTWTSENFYPDTNPSGFLTSADIPHIEQVQSDWAEDDETDPSYIQNKPGPVGLEALSPLYIIDETYASKIGIYTSAIPELSGYVTKDYVDENFYSASNPDGFITSASIPKEIDYFTTASTFDEIKASVNAGHAPVLKVESSSGGVSYKLRLPLVYFETGTMSAQVARFSGTQGDKLYTYTLMAGSWSTETKTVPTVNDGTLTIQQNGQTVATFSANQSVNTTANINVSQAPLQLLTWRIITPSGNSSETVYIEDNYAYYIDMTSTPGLILDTNVTDHPVHTIIQMGAAGSSGVSNCPTWTVAWNDETLSLHEIKFQCASTGTDVNYMIDVTIQKLWSADDQQYYTVARVFDMPVLLRRYIPQHYVDDSTVMQVGAYRNLV